MSVKTKRYQRILLRLFGIFLAIIILEITLNVLGYIYSEKQESFNVDYENKTVILCIGESTTADLNDGSSSWPRELQKILDDESLNKYKVVNEGVPGTRMGFVLERLDGQIREYNPKYIISMLGINEIRKAPIIYNTNRTENSLKIFSLSKWLIKSVSNNFCYNYSDYDPGLYSENKIKKKIFFDRIRGCEIYDEVKASIFLFENEPKISALKQQKYHYDLLQKKLAYENIIYIAMQYPTLNITILKNMFKNDINIILLENKDNFNSNLLNHSYEELFSDMFAIEMTNNVFSGHYGHTTTYGSKIIAQNVAKKIIELEFEG
jgi:hypothetical protein